MILAHGKSISRICNKDGSENTSQGNVFLSNSKRTFVRAESLVGCYRNG